MRTHSRTKTIAAALAATMMASLAQAAAAGQLAVEIGGVDHAGRLPDEVAFCPPASSAKKNISPAVKWSAGPKGTRSYALLMTDPDVPQDLGLINKAGTTIAADAARITVYHWVLDDIPVHVTALAYGIESEGLVPRGKPIGKTDHGRRGANVFTTFLASNADMAGTYGGYDGPCPPINDARTHRYSVRVFALDVPTLELTGAFDGASVEIAMRGHVLAQGEAAATYALAPPVVGEETQ